jgi:hypothetical protein
VGERRRRTVGVSTHTDLVCDAVLYVPDTASTAQCRLVSPAVACCRLVPPGAPSSPSTSVPPGVASTVSPAVAWRAYSPHSPADGDRNAELSNANKSFADRRVTGDPPCSSPKRRATSTQILESTNNHKPYFIKYRTGFCLLSFISDVLTTSLAEERANSRAEKRKCSKAGSHNKKSWARRNF